LQTASQAAAQWTEDGLASAFALELVVVALIPEYAATLRLQMAAKIVLAMQSAHATHKPVQVRLVCVKEL